VQQHGTGTPPPTTTPRAPGTDSRDDIYRVSVNLVVVPVTVKDAEGRLVQGLVKDDFAVYENGQPQKVSFFTSDPFPISAAIVIDLGLPDSELRKVQATLPALFGAFGQFDEVAVYTYGDTVQRVLNFAPATSPEIDAVIPKLRSYTGEQGGVPVVGGPMNSPPVINGKPVMNPGMTPEQVEIQNYHQTARVLNDALLAAAGSLADRPRGNRRILFVVSEGTERGSNSSYADTLKFLLSHEVSVYGVVVSPPGLSTVQRLKLPRIQGANVLPKYANATGGQWYSEFSQSSVESAYSRITEEARNQYTLGYTTRASLSTAYRSIDVHVHRPGLKVYARDGYYPLPPRRQ
jgi:VWFA-related protein